MPSDLDDISSIAALDDELRRKMYLLIRAAGTPLSREDVSQKLGVSVKLAAFHLDKLVDRGILQAHYARPIGRSGPGAGRSSKFYEPADSELSVAIPSRDYELIGSLLMEAIGNDTEVRERAIDAARNRGRQVLRKLRARGGSRSQADLSLAVRSLRQLGYEPYKVSALEVRLRNCPFHSLARKEPDVVCPINKGLIDGLLGDFRVATSQITSGPADGACCVAITTPAKNEDD